MHRWTSTLVHNQSSFFTSARTILCSGRDVQSYSSTFITWPMRLATAALKESYIPSLQRAALYDPSSTVWLPCESVPEGHASVQLPFSPKWIYLWQPSLLVAVWHETHQALWKLYELSCTLLLMAQVKKRQDLERVPPCQWSFVVILFVGKSCYATE